MYYRAILSLETPNYCLMRNTGKCKSLDGSNTSRGVHVVFLRCRYVYINFQVIISITQFCIDNCLGPLARESPCITVDHYKQLFINFCKGISPEVLEQKIPDCSKSYFSRQEYERKRRARLRVPSHSDRGDSPPTLTLIPLG